MPIPAKQVLAFDFEGTTSGEAKRVPPSEVTHDNRAEPAEPGRDVKNLSGNRNMNYRIVCNLLLPIDFGLKVELC